MLDRHAVNNINPNLTSTADVTQAAPLAENLGVTFMGDTKGGAFDISEEIAIPMLHQPNPHGKPNSDVIMPWVNGLDITRRPRGLFILDFGLKMPPDEVALYDAPFTYLQEHVYPARAKSRSTVQDWWSHERPRVDMRSALQPLPRFVVTLTVSKHRLFVWMSAPALPDHQLIAFAATMITSSAFYTHARMKSGP